MESGLLPENIAFELFSPEELDDYISKKTSEIDAFLSEKNKLIHVKSILEFVSALITKGSTLQAAKILAQIKNPITETAHHENATIHELELFARFSLTAVRFIPPSYETFADFDILYDAIKAYVVHHQENHFYCFSLKFALLNYYQDWLKNGGNPIKLAKEDLKFIEETQEKFENDLINEAESIKDIQESISLIKLLYRFYLKMEKPNEAIQELKKLAELVPLTEAFHASELGEINFDIGQILFGYKKFGVAKSYFEKAFNIYLECGEDYEMFAAQSEAWIESCENEE